MTVSPLMTRARSSGVIKVNGERRLMVRNVVSEDGKTISDVSTVTNRGQINQVVITRAVVQLTTEGGIEVSLLKLAQQ